MSGILSAIRGGLDSQSTIARAVTLARQTDLPLHFLYVVNSDFLSGASSSRVRAVLSEHMRQMGESVLLAAQALANARGVMARGVIRYGSVENEIAELCRELGADYLVLGRPSTRTERGVCTLIEQVEEWIGTRVVLSNGDEK